MEPYRPNEPFIKMKLNGSLLDRMVEAGIPLTRALQYFRDNPEGPATKTLSMIADEFIPFKYNIQNNGSATDFLKEAVMLGIPINAPKATRRVITPRDNIIDIKLNSEIPALDVERNAILERNLEKNNDVGWRADEYNNWYSEAEPEFGDTYSPSEYGEYKRYESPAHHPDDWNNLVDEMDIEGIEYDEGARFEPGSREYLEQEDVANALDKVYSEMNDRNALLTNEQSVARDLDIGARRAYWNKLEDIFDKYKAPDWTGTKSWNGSADKYTSADFNPTPVKLTPEEIASKQKYLNQLQEGIDKYMAEDASPEFLDGLIERAGILQNEIQSGYKYAKKPMVAQAFPDYESYVNYRNEIAPIKIDDFITEAKQPKSAVELFDYVNSQPIPTEGNFFRPRFNLTDQTYTFEPRFGRSSDDILERQLKDYKEPFRITVEDFNELTKLIDSKRDISVYGDMWADNLHNQVNAIDNEMITAEDKALMNAEIDKYKEILVNEPDPNTRNRILRELQSNLDALGVSWLR